MKHMTGYKIVHLKLMVDELGEEKTKELLSKFSCPMNPDVESFLRVKAIEFAKQGLAQTHMVYASYKGALTLAGYFSLSNKHITVKSSVLHGKLKQRIRRFSTYDPVIKSYCMAAPLIAQLGKNYINKEISDLISGDELLKLACDTVAAAQFNVGGRFVYLECEDKQKLIEFYSENGFCEFDRRTLDRDETGLSGDYLVQMLKYLH